MEFKRFGWGIILTEGGEQNTGGIHGPESMVYEGSPAEDLDALKAALRFRLIAEAVRQSGLSADVLARVIELTNTLNDENADEQARTSAQLELEQHNEYREKATLVEAAKQRKLAEIDAIETVEDALTYSVEDGWP